MSFLSQLTPADISHAYTVAIFGLAALIAIILILIAVEKLRAMLRPGGGDCDQQHRELRNELRQAEAKWDEKLADAQLVWKRDVGDLHKKVNAVGLNVARLCGKFGVQAQTEDEEV